MVCFLYLTSAFYMTQYYSNMLIDSLVDRQFLNTIFHDWDLKTFTDVKVVHPDTTSKVGLRTVCGENFEPILEGSKTIPFEGSMKGCFCSDIENLHKRICKDSEIERGCVPVDSIPSKEMIFYKGGIICAKREKTNFDQIVILSQYQKRCPSSYKPCGRS